jgi:hypothetical protein
MKDIEVAKEIFNSRDYSCVLVRRDISYTSTLKGVSPMIGFLTSGVDLNGFSVADKIVGKAAALLFALAGIRHVYATTMSVSAVGVLQKHGIRYEYEILVDAIRNRDGTGPCPIEGSVMHIEDCHAALAAIVAIVEGLKRQ